MSSSQLECCCCVDDDKRVRTKSGRLFPMPTTTMVAKQKGKVKAGMLIMTRHVVSVRRKGQTGAQHSRWKREQYPQGAKATLKKPKRSEQKAALMTVMTNVLTVG